MRSGVSPEPLVSTAGGRPAALIVRTWSTKRRSAVGSL